MRIFTSNIDISTSQMLPIPFNPGYYMLKSGVGVKWPEDMLGCLIMGEICYATEFGSNVAMELVCVRMSRPFAANRLLTVV